MEAIEAIAIARLRQWNADRQATRHGKGTTYKHRGWQERRAGQYDAAQVRVIDFERAMQGLDEEEQIALVSRYVEGQRDTDTARLIQCSTRKVSYLIPCARRKLTAILDRLDLL